MSTESNFNPDKMKNLVTLCKRRGILFQSSEIYGGLNGFWDYGPLGVEIKRNVKEAWWHDMVQSHNEMVLMPGAPSKFEMVGLDCSIIMHPQVWKCSGHYDLFHDEMVDCTETKGRYRYDQMLGRWAECKGQKAFITADPKAEDAEQEIHRRAMKFFNLRAKDEGELKFTSDLTSLTTLDDFSQVLAPEAKHVGTLTEPREFNLMFKTIVGALGTEENAAFLRPETAQGIFVNFRNVVDSTRVRVPFGVGQIGKSFRNEITPRNFTFRSREFEQMEIEFFCPPEESRQWYEFWRNRRYEWYLKMGLAGDRLRLRDHEQAELAHYSTGTADIEYSYPFLQPGEFGELEGIAHRGDFDLRSHMEGKLVAKDGQLTLELDENGKPKHRGSGKDMSYFDDLTKKRFIPHVIEPSAGADRATLAFLCEAFQEDQAPDENGNMTSRTVLRLHPRLAPYKAAVLPLVRKDGMPELGAELYGELKEHFPCFYDEKAAIGRRYRRQDEIGTPFCVTIDSQTLVDGTVTVRDRDTLEQSRVKKDEVAAFIEEKIKG